MALLPNGNVLVFGAGPQHRAVALALPLRSLALTLPRPCDRS